jgi:hypothetical protein
MAHFYGVVSGRGRTTASRVGRKTTGLQTVAASWHGAVKVSLYERDGTDHALVELTQWRGAGTNRVLYDGPVVVIVAARVASRPNAMRIVPKFFLLLTRCLPDGWALRAAQANSLKRWRARQDSNL